MKREQCILLDPVSISADIPCKIEYLPNSRCKKPRTIIGSHKVWGLVNNLSDDQFPLAFNVTTFEMVCKQARTQEDISLKQLPIKSGYFTVPVRTYDGKCYSPYQFIFGAARTTRGVSTMAGLKWEIKRHFNPCNAKMTPPETGEFGNNNIIVSHDQEDTFNEFKKFCEQFVSFHGKLWVECGEPFYHFIPFGCCGEHGSVGFFVDYEKEWLTWHAGSLVYNAKHRKKCIQEARSCAIRRGNNPDLLADPKENIEVIMPKMVKIKENIF